MQVKLIEDAKVLVPNSEHKNFTEGKELLQKDTILTGEPKLIAGLRRGEPFNYRLFRTDQNQLIYLNKIRNMDTTEVKLGAEGDPTPTKINLKQTFLAQPANLAAIGGAVIGFGYAKYKKHDMKKALIYTVVGGVVGFVAGKIASHTGIIKASK
jgi:hypothetical protein